ncbi:MAG: AMP-binding protein [Planctomycetota bacterium]|jgi:acyl-[acyl-carrier-protein]-phospholipid O-acyltransferase/long-chain-fatty-acid--[acyl-carrier-protein] ligase
MMHLIASLMVLPFYRITVRGAENIPETGGALFVSNHVSFVDWLFLGKAIKRPIRFIVAEQWFKKWWIKPVLKAVGAIPVRGTGGPKVVMRALKAAGKYLDDGEIVCIFAEGQVTRTGALQPFRRGVERIAKGHECPVIPIHLDGVWGSVFSAERGRLFTKLPRRWRYPVTVMIGKPLPADSSATEVRRRVLELANEAWMQRKPVMHPLSKSIIRMGRKRRFGVMLHDAMRGSVRGYKALAGAVILARALKLHWEEQKVVGILLPPSVAGALVNMAAVISHRATVNLNYTVGKLGIEAACKKADLKTVITSRTFEQKAKLEMPEGVKLIYLEDVAKTITAGQRIKGLLYSLFLPCGMLTRKCKALPKPSMDDTATIIFSSGSTGEPKGIVLSHFNVIANVDGSSQMLHMSRKDNILHMLPFFHSFGNLLLWVGVHCRAGLCFLPNPLDADAVGEMVELNSASILVATPTFLQMYSKRIPPEQFGSLRMVVAGAEKLPRKFAAKFRDVFGIDILEGYGATECAPVISVNVNDERSTGVYQKGNKPGTVGHPFPGVIVRVVDPDTGKELETDQPGMLLVKGPNVMQGYLNDDRRTAEVLNDGWYRTGDIARVDEDGYITITDRLSRFSKIGGEMIPHGKVEDCLHEVLDTGEKLLAVTAVPDEKKGERLVVVHTPLKQDPLDLVHGLKDLDLPGIFIPNAKDFIEVVELPLLGTGKLDLKALKRIAIEDCGPVASDA